MIIHSLRPWVGLGVIGALSIAHIRIECTVRIRMCMRLPIGCANTMAMKSGWLSAHAMHYWCHTILSPLLPFTHKRRHRYGSIDRRSAFLTAKMGGACIYIYRYNEHAEATQTGKYRRRVYTAAVVDHRHMWKYPLTFMTIDRWMAFD